MKNKGFTLVELIGTLAILSLLLIIITPLVTNSLRGGTEKADEQFKESMEMAAKSWGSDNKDFLPENKNEQIKVMISSLKSEGYLDDDVKLPSTGEDKSTSCVFITKTNDTGSEKNAYSYSYSDNCN